MSAPRPPRAEASRPSAAPSAAPGAPAGRGSRDRFRISGISVVAGAAAAATASAATSVLGVAGTVVGAAVVSAVITVAAAVYDHSLRAAKIRLAERMEVTALLPRLGSDGSVVAEPEATGEPAAQRAIRASFISPLEATAEGVDTSTSLTPIGVAAGAETTAELPVLTHLGQQRELPLDALDLEDERGYHWGRIAAVSLLVFALAMVVITGFELLTGRPLSSLFTDSPTRGTTVGRIVRPHHASTTPAPTPTSPSPTPTSPSPTPTSPSPTPTPTSPSPTPTTSSPPATRSPTATASATPKASGSPSPSPTAKVG